MAGLTELRAVNMMLANIGESPISSLETSDATGDASVITAQNILENVSEMAQHEDWEFNKDEAFDLTPDGSGYIAVTSSMISVEATYGWPRVTEREGKLYDITENTYVFTDTITCDIKRVYDFTDTPAPFRFYVAIRAARVFAETQLGQNAGQLTLGDEARARGVAKANDLKNAKRTFFNSNYKLARSKMRSPR